MLTLKIIHELIDEFGNADFSQVPMRFIAYEPHGEYVTQCIDY